MDISKKAGAMLSSSASRRSLLKAVAAGSAWGLGGIGLTARSSMAQEKKITAQDIAACDTFTGIDFSAAEEEQITHVIDEQLEAVRAMLAFSPENDLAPAELFDPRLIGWRPRPSQNGDPLPQEAAPPLPRKEADIAFAPVWQQAHWIKSGQVSSRKLVDIYLNRIAKYDSALKAFVTLLADEARRTADERDRELKAGHYRGPLHGIPYGLKDLIDVAGVRTTWGAATHREYIAEKDAHVAKALKDAGAVLLGKTTCGALAYGDIWFGGKTRNPWNNEEGSSGSSAGTGASVAAGLVSFGIGSETLGSIVSPSNRNGVTGLRPTFGRVGRSGAMALCWSFDKIGPMCRSVWDTALVLAAINGNDGIDPAAIDMPFGYGTARPVKGLTLGYDPAWFEGDMVPETDRQALESARKLGMTLKQVKLPDLPYGVLGSLVIIEAAAAFEDLTKSGQDDQLTWQDDQAWPNSWRAARFMPAVSYVQMQRLRRKVMQRFGEVMEGVDALIHPNYAADLLVIGNATGHPTLALRAGLIEQPTRQGFGGYIPPKEYPKDAKLRQVPRNISLTGHLFDEGTLLSIGAALEKELGVWQQRPPMK